MPTNTVAHFEIYATDPDALAQFYTTLFDWKVETLPGMDYRVVQTVETEANSNRPAVAGGINGGIARRPDGYRMNGAVNYITVDSIEDTVERARALGAQVTRDKQPVPGMGWFAMFIDPQGNHFAVWVNDPDAR